MGVIPRALHEHINTAFPANVCLVATVLPTGFAQITPRGSTMVYDDDHLALWERGKIESGIEIQPIEMGYNAIALDDGAKQAITDFAHAIADQQHLNIAIEPRVSEKEISEFGKADDPFPLFEIIEARTQEVQSVIEDAGILSDRIRRRGAPPWDFEEFIEKDPEFLDRYMNSRKAEKPGVEVSTRKAVRPP